MKTVVRVFSVVVFLLFNISIVFAANTGSSDLPKANPDAEIVSTSDPDVVCEWKCWDEIVTRYRWVKKKVHVKTRPRIFREGLKKVYKKRWVQEPYQVKVRRCGWVCKKVETPPPPTPTDVPPAPTPPEAQPPTTGTGVTPSGGSNPQPAPETDEGKFTPIPGLPAAPECDDPNGCEHKAPGEEGGAGTATDDGEATSSEGADDKKTVEEEEPCKEYLVFKSDGTCPLCELAHYVNGDKNKGETLAWKNFPDRCKIDLSAGQTVPIRYTSPSGSYLPLVVVAPQQGQTTGHTAATGNGAGGTQRTGRYLKERYGSRR